MKTQNVIIALTVLFITNSVSAQGPKLSLGKPAEVGMDEVILNAGVNMFKVAVEKDKLRSVVLLVARKGKVVVHEAIGWKDKEKGIRIEKDSLFRPPSHQAAYTKTRPSPGWGCT